MLTTTQRPTNELKPHPANPRNGDTTAIAQSLQANGQYKPIVTTTDGTILAGNHTYAAALELGWDELSVVTLPITPDSPEALRIMLADNRTSDLGRYDDALLLNLLETVTEADALMGTAYEPYDVDDLRAILDYRQHVPHGESDAVGTSHLAAHDGVAADPGFPGLEAGYKAKGTRPIILDYPVDGYGQVVAALARARVKADVATNAEAVSAALNAYAPVE